MSFYGCLVLPLYKWKPPCLGPQKLGLPPPNDLSPIHTVMSFKVIHSSYGSAVDLVKSDLVLMHFPLFTPEGEKYSYYNDPFHTMRYFIPTHGPPYPFIHLLDDIRKINVPISFMLILGTLQSSPPKCCLSSSNCKDRNKGPSWGMRDAMNLDLPSPY